jgi:hypothetical protein
MTPQTEHHKKTEHHKALPENHKTLPKCPATPSPTLSPLYDSDPFLEQELPRSNRFFLPQGVIDTAYMNAKRDRGHYDIRFQEKAKESGTWLVIHKDGNPKRRYVVNAFDWTCTCPYFKNSCFCKHCRMVADELFPLWGVETSIK